MEGIRVSGNIPRSPVNTPPHSSHENLVIKKHKTKKILLAMLIVGSLLLSSGTLYFGLSTYNSKNTYEKRIDDLENNIGDLKKDNDNLKKDNDKLIKFNVMLKKDNNNINIQNKKLIDKVTIVDQEIKTLKEDKKNTSSIGNRLVKESGMLFMSLETLDAFLHSYYKNLGFDAEIDELINLYRSQGIVKVNKDLISNTLKLGSRNVAYYIEYGLNAAVSFLDAVNLPEFEKEGAPITGKKI